MKINLLLGLSLLAVFVGCQNNIQPNNNLSSVITCPNCGFKKSEVMPTDVCVIRYTCVKCKKELTPKDTDCCVYCSYGSKPCPSKNG